MGTVAVEDRFMNFRCVGPWKQCAAKRASPDRPYDGAVDQRVKKVVIRGPGFIMLGDFVDCDSTPMHVTSTHVAEEMNSSPVAVSEMTWWQSWFVRGAHVVFDFNTTHFSPYSWCSRPGVSPSYSINRDAPCEDVQHEAFSVLHGRFVENGLLFDSGKMFNFSKPIYDDFDWFDEL